MKTIKGPRKPHPSGYIRLKSPADVEKMINTTINALRRLDEPDQIMGAARLIASLSHEWIAAHKQKLAEMDYQTLRKEVDAMKKAIANANQQAEADI